MKNLTQANEARKEKALNKLYNFSDYGITTFKKLIDKGVFIKSEISEAPKYKWNRVKYNRMNGREQEEYDKKMEEKKTVYYLYYDERLMTEVSKFVYEYFEELNEELKCYECEKIMTDLESNYGTEDFPVCIHCDNEAQEIGQMLGIKRNF